MFYSSFYAWLNVREIWRRVIQQFPKLALRCLLLSPTYLFCFGSTKWRSVPFNTLTAEGHGRTNPFASATKIALARALFVSSKEIRLHLCHRQHCCRTLCCMLRFACNSKNKHECFRFAFLPSLADCLAGACISHAPAKMPFEVFFVVDINRVSSLSSKQLQIMYYPTCKKYWFWEINMLYYIRGVGNETYWTRFLSRKT